MCVIRKRILSQPDHNFCRLSMRLLASRVFCCNYRSPVWFTHSNLSVSGFCERMLPFVGAGVVRALPCSSVAGEILPLCLIIRFSGPCPVQPAGTPIGTSVHIASYGLSGAPITHPSSRLRGGNTAGRPIFALQGQYAGRSRSSRWMSVPGSPARRGGSSTAGRVRSRRNAGFYAA